jgi:hypothetical protein
MIGSEIKYNCEDFCWMMNSSCIIVVKIESNVVSYPLPRWIQIPIWWDISTFRTGFWCVTVSLVFLLLVGTCSHGFWWCFRSTWCENARKWKSCMWGINYVRCEIFNFYDTSMLARVVHGIIFFLNIIYVFVLKYYLSNLV